MRPRLPACASQSTNDFSSTATPVCARSLASGCALLGRIWRRLERDWWGCRTTTRETVGTRTEEIPATLVFPYRLRHDHDQVFVALLATLLYANTKLSPFPRSVNATPPFSLSIASSALILTLLKNHLTIPPALFSSSCVPTQYLALVPFAICTPLCAPRFNCLPHRRIECKPCSRRSVSTPASGSARGPREEGATPCGV